MLIIYYFKKSQTLSHLGFLAGYAGFEPANAGVKVLCLTPWRIPNIHAITVYHKPDIPVK